MKVTQKHNSEVVKKTYFPPVVEKVSIDNEISLVMMSGPPTEFPTQDPLMSIKVFKTFK